MATWAGGKRAMDTDALDGEPSKRRGRQTPKRLPIKPATRLASERVKATIHLSRDPSIRLTVHAELMAIDRSALVETLIHDHPRRYVVSDRGGDSESPAA